MGNTSSIPAFFILSLVSYSLTESPCLIMRYCPKNIKSNRKLTDKAPEILPLNALIIVNPPGYPPAAMFPFFFDGNRQPDGFPEVFSRNCPVCVSFASYRVERPFIEKGGTLWMIRKYWICFLRERSKPSKKQTGSTVDTASRWPYNCFLSLVAVSTK